MDVNVKHTVVGDVDAGIEIAGRFLSREAFALISCIGFGMLLAWKHLNISPTLFDAATRSVVLDLRSGGLGFAPLYLVLPLVLAFLARKGIEPPQRPVVFAATLVMAVSVLALYELRPMSELSSLAVGSACAIASALLLLYWVKFLCEVVPGNPLKYASVSFCACFGIALLITFVPGQIVFVVHAALPLISGGLLAFLMTKAAIDAQEKAKELSAPWRVPLRLFVGIAVILLCIDLTNVLSEVRTDTPNEMCLLVVGLLASLMVLALSSEKEFANLGSSFKVALVVILVSMFAVLIFEFEQRIYETAALALGGCLFRIFFYAIIFEVVRRYEGNVLYPLGIGISVIALTQFLFPRIYDAISWIDLSAVSVVSAMTICAVVTILFILDEKYIFGLLSSKVVRLNIDDDFACRRCVGVAAKEHGLTNREEQIALMVLQRKSNSEIAESLFIAPSTLQVHLRNIHKKIGVHSRSELIEYLESLASE